MLPSSVILAAVSDHLPITETAALPFDEEGGGSFEAALSRLNQERVLRPPVAPMRSMTANITKNTKNRIFAIPIEAPAMPVNPNRAASKPRTRNVSAQCSMGISRFRSQLLNVQTGTAFRLWSSKRAPLSLNGWIEERGCGAVVGKEIRTRNMFCRAWRGFSVSVVQQGLARGFALRKFRNEG